MKKNNCSIANVRNKTIKIKGESMETMSFHFGIDDYFYYNKSTPRKNDNCKEMVTPEINNSKKYNEGEKNK